MSSLAKFGILVALVLTMADYFSNSAVMAADKESPEAIATIENLLKPKPWAKVYALPRSGTQTSGPC